MRLGVYDSLSSRLVMDTFQFQLGAIGSAIFDQDFCINLFVSIPAWCDWELNSMLQFDSKEGFQFQLGAIGRW